MKTFIKMCDLLAGINELGQRMEQLELKFQQLKKDIDALFEITNKIRPKYYKVDNEYLLKRNELPATPSATPGSIEPVDYFTTGP